ERVPGAPSMKPRTVQLEAVLCLGDREAPEADHTLLVVGVDADPVAEDPPDVLDLAANVGSYLFEPCRNAQGESPVRGERDAPLRIVELREHVPQPVGELPHRWSAVFHHALSLRSSSDSKIGHAEAGNFPSHCDTSRFSAVRMARSVRSFVSISLILISARRFTSAQRPFGVARSDSSPRISRSEKPSS